MNSPKATFTAPPFVIDPNTNAPTSARVLQISQQTRLALNLFDPIVTSYHSRIRNCTHLPFWRPVLRSVEGRYIYTSNFKAEDPYSFIELCLLPFHLTPAYLRENSSNSSASFFLILHPLAITTPLPVSDKGSLRRCLAYVDECLEPLFSFEKQTPRSVQSARRNSSTVTVNSSIPPFSTLIPSPSPLDSVHLTPMVTSSSTSSMDQSSLINQFFELLFKNDLFVKPDSNIISKISPVLCLESLEQYSSITVPFISSINSKSVELKRSRDWLKNLDQYFRDYSSVTLSDGRLVRTLKSTDDLISFVVSKPPRLSSPSITTGKGVLSSVGLSSLPQSKQVEVVCLSKRTDLFSLRDVSSTVDADHVISLLNSSTDCLSDLTGLQSSEIFTFISYPPPFWHFYCRSTVKTPFLGKLEEINEVKRIPVADQQLIAYYDLGFCYSQKFVEKCLKNSCAFFVNFNFSFYLNSSHPLTSSLACKNFTQNFQSWKPNLCLNNSKLIEPNIPSLDLQPSLTMDRPRSPPPSPSRSTVRSTRSTVPTFRRPFSARASINLFPCSSVAQSRSQSSTSDYRVDFPVNLEDFDNLVVENRSYSSMSNRSTSSIKSRPFSATFKY
ncbi:hypothetical protein RCL1_003651 [Eukaryota sp. TZLM3-RCL]